MEPNLPLKLLSTAEQTQAEQSTTYHLQLGNVVTWDVPASFAERLQEVHKLLRE